MNILISKITKTAIHPKKNRPKHALSICFPKLLFSSEIFIVNRKPMNIRKKKVQKMLLNKQMAPPNKNEANIKYKIDIFLFIFHL
ncbi:hypothetical protein PAECIP111891_07027 [Paenibacillus allorhizoplanae]|uniref:Uncharacterized protein n=1 Tax=Paenibacillus allorhizoplanae TaxID=2905648 RepID=A0ABN8HAW9_9BACL|nr:hypothetical protein PAECIP111891_07027 [Paenibacillus allorhizoplanae]